MIVESEDESACGVKLFCCLKGCWAVDMDYDSRQRVIYTSPFSPGQASRRHGVGGLTNGSAILGRVCCAHIIPPVLHCLFKGTHLNCALLYHSHFDSTLQACHLMACPSFTSDLARSQRPYNVGLKFDVGEALECVGNEADKQLT